MSQTMGDPGRWEASLRWSTVFAVWVLAFAALVQAWLGGPATRPAGGPAAPAGGPAGDLAAGWASGPWPLTLSALAYAVAGIAFSARALGTAAGAPRASGAWLSAVVVVGLALTAVAALRVSAEVTTADQVAAGTLVVIAPGASALVAALRWGWGPLVVLAAVHAAAIAALLGVRGLSWKVCAGVAAAGFVGALVMGAAGRLTTWMREAGRELVAARETRARLAVADERLRFARDLHDVHGRTLAAVSVHSQLGAELARRGDPTAAEHMLTVHRLAQDSLVETRRLVSGYREVALAEEVASARALLHAGGVAVRVMWPPEDGVPAGAAAAALAVVVREGVTNVLRHSAAGEVVLRLERRGTDWRLTLENDGVGEVSAPGDPRTEGADDPSGRASGEPSGRAPAGLAGLRERLRQVGGSLAVTPGRDRYVLVAQVPEGGHG